MHPQHEQQVNDSYIPRAVESWQVQLDNALAAALRTKGKVASYWVDRCESLVGRIAIAQAGGTIRDAIKFVPESVLA